MATTIIYISEPCYESHDPGIGAINLWGPQMRFFRSFIAFTLLILWLSFASPRSRAQQPTTSILFDNVRVFTGKTLELSPPMHVLIKGEVIADMSRDPIAAEPETIRIDGTGKVLMPGMIDAHWHTFLAGSDISDVKAAEDPVYLHLRSAAEAKATLLRGFTTVRDAGGPSFALKRVIDEGTLVGPRIYPSGALITQTGGHADFRSRAQANPQFGGAEPYSESIGLSIIADGPNQVLAAVREQLRLGATQIKLTTTGGVASDLDPIDGLQFTPEEIRAAVQAASDWGTYVMVHNYTSDGAKRAIEAGVKCIEHGNLLDESAVKLAVEKGVWLDIQPFIKPYGKGPQFLKSSQVVAGTDNVYRLAKKYHAKIAWGTDLGGSFEKAAQQNDYLLRLTHWFTAPEILQMVTATNGELMALSGRRNTYPKKLGTIEQGAYADLLLVNGDPTADINILDKPDQNLLVIVKNGEIVKNIFE